MITKEEAQQLYTELIELRQVDVLKKDKNFPGKVEGHHILPISCGGLDISTNIVYLYAKEHFMAHVYLWAIHHDDEFHSQTVCALKNMIKGTLNGSRTQLREFILASEEYQKAREEFAKLQSESKSGEASSGENNSNYNKHWYYDPITLECGSFYEDAIPEGWVAGRKYKNPELVSQHISESQQNVIWIRRKDLTQRSQLNRDKAQILLNTGEWELGKSLEPNKNKVVNKNNKKYIYQKSCICANCDIEFMGNSKYCCDQCRKEADLKQRAEKTKLKHKEEVEILQTRGYFDCQSTELYKGIVNRKQVKRYFETIGKICCDICGKSDCKLIVHSIDNNPKNLLIFNYNYLCKDCYYKEINNLFNYNQSRAYKD